MTRKHFRLIADTISDLIESERLDPAQGRLLARRLAEEFEGVNPNFDRDRFVEACFPVPAFDRVH
tara:strand:- start:234 stop:428 length:195 start_codon:yes stop_codon:yes gene_type:complete